MVAEGCADDQAHRHVHHVAANGELPELLQHDPSSELRDQRDRRDGVGRLEPFDRRVGVTDDV